MTKSIPEDVKKAANNFDKTKEKEIKPFDVYDVVRDINETLRKIKNVDKCMESAEKLKKDFDKDTPRWLYGFIAVERNPKREIISIKLEVVEDYYALGDQIMEQNHLVRFPQLNAGAVYDVSNGNWRYFGKDELNLFSKKEAMEEIKRWDLFRDMKPINLVGKYLETATYDDSYPNDTPFIKSRPELVVFNNGTYNILTDEMRPNDPEDYILNSYDYDLPMEDQETPKTDQFLKDMFGDSWLFLKQYIGYGFYRSYAPSQEIVFLHGEGGEGKSTFLNFLTKYIYNEKNVSNEKVQDLSANRFSAVNLLGKSMNICGEVPKGNMKNSDRLKTITGNDKFMGEFKGVQGFMMRNYAKLMFSANELPGFRDLSGGFAARLVVINAINGNQRKEDATFFKEHPIEELIKEAPSFARSCIQEFRKVFDGNHAAFTRSEQMESDRLEWLYDNDYLEQFIEESCTITPGDDKGTSVKLLMEEYKEFCKLAGVWSEKKATVDKRLKKIGCGKKKTSRSYDEDNMRVWRYMGCKLDISYKNPLNN